jgi:hypothetical protein
MTPPPLTANAEHAPPRREVSDGEFAGTLLVAIVAALALLYLFQPWRRSNLPRMRLRKRDDDE